MCTVPKQKYRISLEKIKFKFFIADRKKIMLHTSSQKLVSVKEGIWIWILRIFFDLKCSFCHILQSSTLESPSWLDHILSCCSVAKSCPTLCNPLNCSIPGFPVLHYLPEFAQTHVHWVSDAIQPSHPLSSPSPAALNLSQHQGLFKWVSSSHEVAKVLVSASASALPMNAQDWSPLGWTGWISLQSKGLSK